ncbi:MAG: FeoC-like transcriptional regulator [Rhodospirillales bacterium]
MLTELKSHLARCQRASLTELARRFSTDPDALRPMLELWVRKGRVRRTAGAGCRGCVSCAAADIEFYEWVEPPPEAKPQPDRG